MKLRLHCICNTSKLKMGKSWCKCRKPQLDSKCPNWIRSGDGNICFTPKGLQFKSRWVHGVDNLYVERLLCEQKTIRSQRFTFTVLCELFTLKKCLIRLSQQEEFNGCNYKLVLTLLSRLTVLCF